jgi:hypothetical protein
MDMNEEISWLGRRKIDFRLAERFPGRWRKQQELLALSN